MSCQQSSNGTHVNFNMIMKGGGKELQKIVTSSNMKQHRVNVISEHPFSTKRSHWRKKFAGILTKIIIIIVFNTS